MICRDCEHFDKCVIQPMDCAIFMADKKPKEQTNEIKTEYKPIQTQMEGIPQEQTNDEWRKTCSAEEFAEWLWKHFDHGEVIVLWEKYGYPMYKDDNGISRADYTEAMKKWLKEEHE